MQVVPDFYIYEVSFDTIINSANVGLALKILIFIPEKETDLSHNLPPATPVFLYY
jgi:hypothetical protein